MISHEYLHTVFAFALNFVLFFCVHIRILIILNYSSIILFECYPLSFITFLERLGQVLGVLDHSTEGKNSRLSSNEFERKILFV